VLPGSAAPFLKEYLNFAPDYSGPGILRSQRLLLTEIATPHPPFTPIPFRINTGKSILSKELRMHKKGAS
jgi:hypothetical protein